ncbi:MAG TPA: hypothetical protein VHI30_06200 [Gaiellales bacterium]|jgi:hypothetical protein|nr:hypothetical protein [Gaiellales bacterium]
MEAASVKLQVQRIARTFERSLNAGDLEACRAHLSAEFGERDGDLTPLLERTTRAELIGTVGNRTLLRLDLDEGENRVVELLWLELHGAWRIHDARIFSLLPGE